jgi:hypothetical protein
VRFHCIKLSESRSRRLPEASSLLQRPDGTFANEQIEAASTQKNKAIFNAFGIGANDRTAIIYYLASVDLLAVMRICLKHRADLISRLSPKREIITIHAIGL